ncbi:DUF418 domain-containing protein [Corynebacterium camporealensis]
MTSTQPTKRMIVPDVARGLSLLGIALANITSAWIVTSDRTASYFGGILRDHLMVPNMWDQVTVIIAALFFHMRGLPMFSTLLGFGVGLIAMSLWRRRFPVGAAKRVIVKRYAFLMLFGALHCLFLFYGDIMLFYGAAGMIIAAMLTLSDKVILRIAYILLGISLFLGLIMGIVGFFIPQLAGNVTMTPEDIGMYSGIDSYGSLLLFQFFMLVVQFFNIIPSLFLLFPVMLIGFVWARRGVLSDVRAHQRELNIWVFIGIGVILLIGLPWGLAEIDFLPAQWSAGFMMLNSFFGVLTGPAFLALLALMLQGVQEKIWNGVSTPWYLWAFAALGKRSMSGYVAQSVLFLMIVYPFTLNIGPEYGAFGQSVIAFLVWLFTLVLACMLEIMNVPGPLEWVHRRLAYGKTRRAELPKRYEQQQPPAGPTA